MPSELVEALKAWDAYDPNISEEKVLMQTAAVIAAARLLPARIEALEAENARLKEEAKAERLVLKALLDGARSENAELRKKLNGCLWYWPEDDTSEDCCGESAQEIVQNVYDWSSKNAGKVVAVARGGIVEVTYCAALPPADDADRDDDFWIEAETEEEAQALLDAEIARRAREGGNVDG